MTAFSVAFSRPAVFLLIVVPLAVGQPPSENKSAGPQGFVQTGTGAVPRPIEEKLRDVISVKDFTKGDGTAIDTAGFVNAINAARGSDVLKQAGGVAIYVPPLQNGKCYQIDKTIVVEAWTGFEMYGGGWGSCLQAVGSSMRSLLYLRGSYSGHIRNIHFRATAEHPLASFIEMSQGNPKGPGHSSQANLLEDVWLDGRDGSVTDSVVVDGEEDANNDFHTFVRVLVQGFTDAAFKLVGSQSYSHKFIDCRISGYYRANGTDHWGSYGVKAISTMVDSRRGAGGAASFTWTGGAIGVSAYDFYISGYSHFPYEISGMNDESHGGQLLYAVGTPCFIILRNGRFARSAADTHTDFIHAEGVSLLINNLFANSFTKTDKADMTIYYAAPGNRNNGQPQVTIEDSEIVTGKTTPATFFTSGQAPSTFLAYRNFAVLSPTTLTTTFMGGVRSYTPSEQIDNLTSGEIRMIPRTIAALTNAAQGTVAFVTDSTTNVLGARAGGGGSYAAIVSSLDGRNWYVVAAASSRH